MIRQFVCFYMVIKQINWNNVPSYIFLFCTIFSSQLKLIRSLLIRCQLSRNCRLSSKLLICITFEAQVAGLIETVTSSDKLCMRKLCARWRWYLLNADQNQTSNPNSHQYLDNFTNILTDFICLFVTADETTHVHDRHLYCQKNK